MSTRWHSFAFQFRSGLRLFKNACIKKCNVSVLLKVADVLQHGSVNNFLTDYALQVKNHNLMLQTHYGMKQQFHSGYNISAFKKIIKTGLCWWTDNVIVKDLLSLLSARCASWRRKSTSELLDDAYQTLWRSPCYVSLNLPVGLLCVPWVELLPVDAVGVGVGASEEDSLSADFFAIASMRYNTVSASFISAVSTISSISSTLILDILWSRKVEMNWLIEWCIN